MVLIDFVILLAVFIGIGMPGILMVRGLYGMMGGLKGHGRRMTDRRLVPGRDEKLKAAQRCLSSFSKEVPTSNAESSLTKEVLDRIERIGALAKESLTILDATAQSSVAAEIRIMRDEHLRDLVHAYCAIPQKHRHDMLTESTIDATARLIEGLDGMIARLVEIENELSRGSLDAFADTTRFVAARYGARRDQI